MHKYKITYLPIFILAVAILIVYYNSLLNPFIWDDLYLIEGNAFIKSWAHIKDIFATQLFQGSGAESNFYRPIQSITLALDHAIWHLNPIGYHITNILLHILTVVLIYFLLLKLTLDNTISLFTSLLFAIHPINTEAITYLSGRADPLSAVFFLSAFITYIKYRENKKIVFYLISLSSFALALLSREGSIILPFLLCLYLAVFTDKKNRALTGLIPFFVISLIYILARLTVLNFHETALISHKVALLNRLMTTSRAVFIYLSLLILPINLRMERYLITSKTIFEPTTLLSVIGVICIFIVAIKLFRRSRLVFFSIAWFFITLLPYSNIVPLNAMMAEHWLYLPSIGFFLIFTTLIFKFFKRVGVYIFLGILIAYSLVTVNQNQYWKNPLIFYPRILKFNPGSWCAHYNLGVVYSRLGLYDDAMNELSGAIALRPDYAGVYYELGIVYFNKGEIDRAISQYEKALELKPGYADAYYNLGRTYEKSGQFEPAENNYRKAAHHNPVFSKAYASLGDLHRYLNNYNEAINQYRLALKFDPKLVEVYINLGAVYETTGMLNDSITTYETGIRYYPKSAILHYNLGLVYKKQGMLDKAIEEYSTAIKLKPDYAEAYGNLGVVYAKKGLINEARGAIKRSLELDPANATMRQNLEKLGGE